MERITITIERARNEWHAHESGIEGYATMNNTDLRDAVERAEYVRDVTVSDTQNLYNAKPILLTPSQTKEPCPVCLDVIEKAVATLCNHTFHEECIQEWAKNSSGCPLCRQSMRNKTD